LQFTLTCVKVKINLQEMGLGIMVSCNNDADTILADEKLLPILRDIAVLAGEKALQLRNGGLKVDRKADDSPVTNADIAANKIICDALQELTPYIPIISEENDEDWPATDALRSGYYWLIDPIDGTRSFGNGGDEFTVNIALMKDERPVIGVIDVPAKAVTYMGISDGVECAAYKQLHDGEALPIQTRKLEAHDDIKVVMSERAYKGEETLPLGFAQPQLVSSSYKFCMLAEGVVDGIAGFGATSEWDIAAGDAIVKAAGGDVKNALGGVFRYNKPKKPDEPRFENPAFIALGDADLEARLRIFANNTQQKRVQIQSHSR